VKLVLIPPGEFLMGSPDSDSEAQTGEKPQHRARITKPFLLGVHEVTVGQFRQFAQSGEYKGSDVWKTAFASQTDDHPVVNVNWDEARAFCHWLSRGERQTYRLPSEAEWEYACRAGSTTKYCFGDGDAQLGDYAWCGSNAGGHTHPVGQKKPNAWGLHDMHGNVWEWCADWCDAGYYSQSLRDDPSGPSSGVDRVLRGGSWHPWAAHTRSGLRLGNHPVSRLPDFGFRVARTCDGATASTATEGSRSGAGGKLADPEAMSGRVTRP
jgi:formylglycine-generating enzyme required for sulfatase activity